MRSRQELLNEIYKTQDRARSIRNTRHIHPDVEALADCVAKLAHAIADLENSR